MRKIIVDYKKCTGCRLCQYVCSHQRIDFKGINPKISAIQVTTLGLYQADVPTLCKHCKKPLCKEKCPVDAFYYDSNNEIWNIEKNKCIGCGVCAEECPFGVITIHPEYETPLKCDLCNGDPVCVKNCVSGALIFSSEVRIGEGSRKRNAQKIAGIKEDR